MRVFVKISLFSKRFKTEASDKGDKVFHLQYMVLSLCFTLSKKILSSRNLSPDAQDLACHFKEKTINQPNPME